MLRSQIMSRVRGKDTKPEMIIRRGLHARGYRYRVHDKKLPGRPDIVLPRWRTVIEVRGCFWHGHENCGRMPKSRQEFWGPKIAGNRERDARNEAALRDAEWRLLIVWECCLAGTGRCDREELLDRIADWVRGDDGFAELEGARKPSE